MPPVGQTDHAFGQAAVQLGALSPQQLQHAFTVQASWTASGRPMPLPEVLQHLRYISPALVQQVIQRLGPAIPPPPAMPIPPRAMPAGIAAAVPVAMPGAIAAAVPVSIPAPGGIPQGFGAAPGFPGAVRAAVPAAQPPVAPPRAQQPKSKRTMTQAEMLGSLSQETSIEDHLVGGYLGNYKIEAQIGRGGLGIVFRALQESVNRPVAIKVLAREIASDPVAMGRFKREAVSAGKVTHPNVVGVIDFGQDKGLHYMVMPFVKGETLKARLIRKKRLALRTATEVLAQVARGLEAIQKAGLVHRDMKPENLMIDAECQVRILDLGLAKPEENAQDTLTQQGFTVGTPTYMSPEQCMGEDKITIAADVYGLGATVYELLTGAPPYVADSDIGIMKAHVKAPVPNPATRRNEIPTGLAEMIMAMLSKQPAGRPQASQIAEFAEKMLGRDGGSAVPKAGPPAASAGSGSKGADKERGKGARRKSGSKPHKSSGALGLVGKKSRSKKAGDRLSISSESRRSGGRRGGKRGRKKSGSSTAIVICGLLLLVLLAGLILVVLAKQNPQSSKPPPKEPGVKRMQPGG